VSKLSESRDRPSFFNTEVPLVPIRAVLQRVAITENDHRLSHEVLAEIAERLFRQLQIGVSL
jgi:hypothetical protein